MSFNIMNNIDYKVGIYIRLSKEDEEKEKYSESESIQNQRALLMQYIKENKLNFIAEYVDDGISGTSFDRPGFNKMIEDIENGKINMVITKDLSRLGRNYVQSGYYTETYFPEHNVRYIAIVNYAFLEIIFSFFLSNNFQRLSLLFFLTFLHYY